LRPRVSGCISHTMKTVIIGMGNTIMSDDGVGILVARILKERLADNPEIEVHETPLAGMNLITMLEGFETAFVIDAIETTNPVPGVLHKFDLSELAATMHVTSPHGTNLYTAVELGRRCGLQMPQTVTIFAIEIENATIFSSECSPAVECRIPAIADEILSDLEFREAAE
jgi:hydrogenase maturation protease